MCQLLNVIQQRQDVSCSLAAQGKLFWEGAVSRGNESSNSSHFFLDFARHSPYTFQTVHCAGDR